jgi:hypothetical protein
MTDWLHAFRKTFRTASFKYLLNELVREDKESGLLFADRLLFVVGLPWTCRGLTPSTRVALSSLGLCDFMPGDHNRDKLQLATTGYNLVVMYLYYENMKRAPTHPYVLRSIEAFMHNPVPSVPLVMPFQHLRPETPP